MNRLVGVLLILLVIAIASAASLRYPVATSKPQTITESYSTSFTKTVPTTLSFTTVFTETVPTTETEILTNGSTYQVITIVEEYVVSPVGVATAWAYGTCSGEYGTLGVVDSTVSTVYSVYGGISQTAQHVVATITTTTSSPSTFEGVTSTNVKTIFVSTSVSVCPTMV